MSVAELKQTCRQYTDVRYMAQDEIGAQSIPSKLFKPGMLLVPNMLRCCLAICFELSGRKVNTFSQIYKIKFLNLTFRYNISYQVLVFR